MIKIKRLYIENLHTENERGMADLAALTEKLGYNTFRDFFIDNPGAIEAIYDWVSNFYGIDDNGVCDCGGDSGSGHTKDCSSNSAEPTNEAES